MIGWIGVGLLVFAYLLLVTKWARFFIPVDIVASAVLTVHAWMIWDIPFLLVNGFITILLSYKYWKSGGEIRD